MKVALAHEYFAAHGGAERVVEVLHAMWPEAPVYTFFHDRGRYGDLGGWDVRTSYLQQFPIGGGLHRVLLPLYPSAARRLRVADDTDVVLVSTSAFIKGLRLADRTVEVAYCHSPTRYLWDWRDEYLREEVPAPLKKLEGHTAWVEGLAFLNQGQQLASTGADQTVRIWDLTEPKKK